MTGEDDETVEIPIPLEDVVNVEEDEENGHLVLILRGKTAEVMKEVMFKGVMMYAVDRFADLVDATTSKVSDREKGEVDPEK